MLFCTFRWPFATVVRSDKERVYVRFHSEEFETNAINEINCFKDGYNGLLGDAKERIWKDANDIVSIIYFEASFKELYSNGS